MQMSKTTIPGDLRRAKRRAFLLGLLLGSIMGPVLLIGGALLYANASGLFDWGFAG